MRLRIVPEKVILLMLWSLIYNPCQVNPYGIDLLISPTMPTWMLQLVDFGEKDLGILGLMSGCSTLTLGPTLHNCRCWLWDT